jgi:hypothetical protein
VFLAELYIQTGSSLRYCTPDMMASFDLLDTLNYFLVTQRCTAVPIRFGPNFLITLLTDLDFF